MDTRALAHFDVAFHFQHDDRFAHHGAAYALLIGNKTLSRQFVTDKVHAGLNAAL